jgi:hypothetical protein
MAFAGCTAQVNVEAARLRRAPSVVAQILGLRFEHDKLKVTRVMEGKWAAVEVDGEEAFIATFLLNFPRQEFLDQWKKEGPTTSPALGKKARVKWAALPLRRYPDSASISEGEIRRGEIVSQVLDLGDGWALVRGAGDVLGFMPAKSLEVFEEEWAVFLPLSPLHQGEGIEYAPNLESLAQYAWRNTWSPEILAALTQNPDPKESFEYESETIPIGNPILLSNYSGEVRNGNASGVSLISETPSQYLARTAWSPEAFLAEWQASQSESLAMSKSFSEPDIAAITESPHIVQVTLDSFMTNEDFESRTHLEHSANLVHVAKMVDPGRKNDIRNSDVRDPDWRQKNFGFRPANPNLRWDQFLKQGG